MERARFEQLLVAPDATIRDAITAIDAGAIEIALVVDERRRLLATVTDGDVRRALLAGASLSEPVQRVAHASPITAPAGTLSADLLRLMTDQAVEQIPLMRGDVVEDVAFIRDLVSEPLENPVLLMAGGEGRRLRP